MQGGPDRLTEFLAGVLIPPACREHVLGDLRERYESPQQYITEVMRTLPLVVVSRIRRTTDPVVLLMEAFTFYICFLVMASSGQSAFLYEQAGFLRIAIPTAVALLALVLADAYADARKRSPLTPILGVVLAIGFAFVFQAVLLATYPELALPRAIMILGGSVGILLVSTLRFIFPPVADRPQGVNVPSFWQKQELAPMGFSARWVIRALVVAGVLLFVAYVFRKAG